LTVFFRFRIDINTLTNATAIKRLINVKALSEVWSFYSLPKTLSCADLEEQNIPEGNWKTLMTIPQSLSSSSVKQIGLSYNTVHIGCKALKFAIKHADLYVLQYKFENNIGISESYGIFKNEMNFLHKSNLEYLYSNGLYKGKNVCIYFPSPHSFDDLKNRRRLIEYGNKWTKEEKLTFFVVPSVSFQNHTTLENEFTVIPYIGSFSCLKFDSLIWFAPTSLEIISKHFDTVVLSDGKLYI